MVEVRLFAVVVELFGVLFGALLLDDPLTPNFLIGGAMLIIGIVLVTRQKQNESAQT